MTNYLGWFYICLLFELTSGVKGAYVEPKSRPPLPTDIPFKQKLDYSKRFATDQEPDCELSPELLFEINSYQLTVNQIINTALNGDFKGRTYDQLAKFVDIHVNRLTGSMELENAIDYMMESMRTDGLLVRDEEVVVPHWVRGHETAAVVEPTFKKIQVIGLGYSVGTPSEGITKEVMVVRSFDELDEKKDLVAGKIVVFNQGWQGSYGSVVWYRENGPARAAAYGAVAALIESVTPFSLDTPHTGSTSYASNGTKIPGACITREDAEFLYRLYTRGEKITMSLTMLDENLPSVTSRNAFGEIVGRTLPHQFVGVSGHIDSWDLGQGAMDDAGGVLISTQAVALIKYLGLQPRRTLQAILWTGEEFGLIGAQSFVNQHRPDMVKYSAVFESDGGTFKPKGLDFAGTPQAGCIIREILKLMAPLNATTYARYSSVSSDILVMILEGVPGLSLNNEDDNYFWYHHSAADMITVLDTDELDMNTALWAATSYILADLSISLPRIEK